MMEPIEKLKLTHLDIDCLERIFRYLSPGDLINVADSNKQLKQAADLAFYFEYGSKKISIVGFSSDPWRWNVGCRILIRHLKSTLRLLRCFGHLISKLGICLRDEYIDKIELLDTNFSYLVSYIQEYCVKSLTHFEIDGTTGKFNWSHFVKAFPNIRVVDVQSSDLTDDISLIKLFPNMRRLTYQHRRNTDILASIDQTGFSNLEHFEMIDRDSSEAASKFQTIQWPNQLQSLSIPFTAIYPSISEVYAHLQDLRLNEVHSCSYRNRQITTKIHFKTVKRLEIYYSDGFCGIPFSFDQLEELILKFHHSTIYLKYHHKQFYDFISEHPSILKLEMLGKCEINFPELMNRLSSIREMKLWSISKTSDVIRIMNEKKTLKRIECSFEKLYIQVDDVCAQLNDQWCVKLCNFDYTFTRN